MQVCLFCGGDASARDHAARCDGKQGRIEAFDAEAFEAPPVVFDLPAARAARDAAVDAVEDHAAEDFNDAALLALVRVASRDERFIVDAVWQELEQSDARFVTHERRAMGAVMMRGHRERYIEPTEDFRASAQRQCHANPRRVWRSLIWRRAAPSPLESHV